MGSAGSWPFIGTGQPYTMYELSMLAFSYALSQKLDWATKVQEHAIRATWKAEILAESAQQAREDPLLQSGAVTKEYDEEGLYTTRDGDWRWRVLTDEHVEYLLAELTFQATLESAISPSIAPGSYESCTLLPSSLLATLQSEFCALESATEVDWHPGSNDQVRDLVHPSLYAFTWGRTAVRLRDALWIPATAEDFQAKVAAGEIFPREEGQDPWRRWSSRLVEYDHPFDEPGRAKHAWLPADFVVDDQGDVKLEQGSYVPNLPMGMVALKEALEKALGGAVKLWERVLGDSKAEADGDGKRRIEISRTEDWWERWVVPESGEVDWATYESSKQMTVPSCGVFNPTSFSPSPSFSLKGRTLQVIVKLASIVLTPEKPIYKGGVWHIEGTESEAIVASAIWYLDEENAGPSQLAFRRGFGENEVMYGQDDHRGCAIVYGITNDGPCHQSLGSTPTTQGKLLAWPNTYQHRVSSFSLLDPHKPGHRKILCFFLVDPTLRVPSARVVPSQREGWGEEEGQERLTMEEARRIREELMKERKTVIGQEGVVLFERPFSLCEH